MFLAWLAGDPQRLWDGIQNDTWMGLLHHLQGLIAQQAKQDNELQWRNESFLWNFFYNKTPKNIARNENTNFLLSSYILKSVSVPSGQLIAFHKTWSCWAVGFSKELLHVIDSIFSRSTRSFSVNFFSSGAVPLSSFSLPKTKNQTFKNL